MTLTKSLLLGSAATLVVVAGAQAADLPTKKGAPAAEYVKVCKVGDIAGFIIPGSDTCLKISGYVNAQVAMGNVFERVLYFRRPLYYKNDNNNTRRPQVRRLHRLLDPRSGQLRRGDQHRQRAAARPYRNPVELRRRLRPARQRRSAERRLCVCGRASPPASTVRSTITSPAATPGRTSSRPITAAPDQPARLYRDLRRRLLGHPVARAERERVLRDIRLLSGGERRGALGVRAPDIIGSLDVTQSWGGAHLAGVAHNIRVEQSGDAFTDTDTWGYGVIGGVTFNLPMLSAGTQDRAPGRLRAWRDRLFRRGFAGVGRADQGFNTNGNGILFPMADAYYNRHTDSGAVERLVGGGPVDLEGLAAIRDRPGNLLRQRRLRQRVRLLGPVAKGDRLVDRRGVRLVPGQEPRFRARRVYEWSHQSTPSDPPTPAYGAYKNNSDGFNARLHVVRSF